MATLPRSSKHPTPTSSALHQQPRPEQRPHSDFDAGINASVAWTGSLEGASSSPSSFDSNTGFSGLRLSNVRSPNDSGDSSFTHNYYGYDDGNGTPNTNDEPPRPARALYAFVGKPEFQELTVEAGDELEVLKEELADGWSLARVSGMGGGTRGGVGEVGLLPREYYIFTSDFTPSPGLVISPDDVARPLTPMTNWVKKNREGTAASLTPHGSPRPSQADITTGGVGISTTETHSPAAIVPQTTGELWRRAFPFPSFRQSLLGGKSLNRFSGFVTSGAEEFVLHGGGSESEGKIVVLPRSERGGAQFSKSRMGSENSMDSSDGDYTDEDRGRDGTDELGGMSETDRHFVDSGPSWKEKLPPFRVMVHSPSKRSSVLSGAYTLYSVTSLFHTPPSPARSSSPSPDYSHPAPDHALRTLSHMPSRMPTHSITVHRRFSHFVALHTALTRRLPGIALPPLPEKQYAGRFSEDFVEARRGDLERYIGRVVRHPVARYAEVVTFFLSCESDREWKRLIPQHLALPPAGPAFYTQVFHPAFNLDAEDAEDAVDRFDQHTRAVGKGVQGLRNIFGRVREARVEMSKAERLLSYSLLSLITSKPLASASMTGISEEDEEHDIPGKGLLNEDGAWCWREGCSECLKLTKAMQKTSEALQNIADLYDDHARRTQLVTHESLKGMAHPSSLYEGIVSTHKSALSRYNEATQEGHTDDDMAARCETVLNTTMAEMETYHTQKGEDFNTLTKEHLDGEIAFYEQILTRLRTARRTFDPPSFDQLGASPRQASIYERELENPRLGAKPLLQPCPHVFDSAPMRPVSVAIQEGVGMLLGPTAVSATRRGSVFGKFW